MAQQTFRFGMQQVGDKTTDRRIQLSKGDLARSIGLALRPKTFREVPNLASLHPSSIWPDNEAQPGRPCLGGEYLSWLS